MKRKKRKTKHPDFNDKIYKTFKLMRRRISECLGIPFDMDHIFPLSKGGLHHHGNIQVIPSKINARKAASLEYEHELLIHWTQLPDDIVSCSLLSKTPTTISKQFNVAATESGRIIYLNGLISINPCMAPIVIIPFPDVKVAQKPKVPLKECTHCKVDKPTTDYNFCKSTKDKLQVWCVDCRREYANAHYKKNKADYNKRRRELWERKGI